MSFRDDDLEALLDRSPEAFARAPGWNTTVDKKAKTAAATKAAFEVCAQVLQEQVIPC